jgi:hypothetical protein
MVVISMGVSQQAVGVASRGEVERRRGGGGRTSVWRWIGLAVGWGRRDGGRDDRGWKETNPECAVRRDLRAALRVGTQAGKTISSEFSSPICKNVVCR